MFDDIVSNKYFIIALIIALIVVIYLYTQKQSCAVEGMRNIDLTQLPYKLDEKPWVDNKTDKSVAPQKKNCNKQTKRTDEIYNMYIESDSITEPVKKRKQSKRRKSTVNGIPQPLDMRPDLSQCQPCICPGDSSDSDDSPKRTKKN